MNTYKQDRARILQELTMLNTSRLNFAHTIISLFNICGIDTILVDEKPYPVLELRAEKPELISKHLVRCGFSEYIPNVFMRNRTCKLSLVYPSKNGVHRMVVYGSPKECDNENQGTELSDKIIYELCDELHVREKGFSAKQRPLIAQAFLDIGYERICDSLYYGECQYVTLMKNFVKVRNKPILYA